MLELKGKHNTATVYTDNVDNVTISQIIELCNQEAFKDSKIRIMPDCHAGKGCTIGTTMTITNKIVANLVGVDIGCGMATIKLSEKLDLEKLDKVIRKHVPYGFTVHERSREKILKEIFNIDLTKIKCEVNLDRAYKSAGTLGGGNHFIEINKSKNNEYYLTVHTGSRNLGKQIAEYYQKLAIEQCEDKSLQKDLCYLEKDSMADYLHDMHIAQQYSAANRALILCDIIYNYYEHSCEYSIACRDIKSIIIECIHNYIDMESMILRKGAISAKQDETVIIPINMRDGIIIGKGKGNPDWNYSAPHGAGRILSRSKAKEQISLNDFEKSMENVFSTCVKQSTLDEAPQAYKPIEDIVNNIGDTVTIIDVMKPIYNFKAN